MNNIVIALTVFFIFLPVRAMAQDFYRLTGLVPMEEAESTKNDRLPLPTNLRESVSISVKDGDVVLRRFGEKSLDSCAIKIDHKYNYHFNLDLAHVFGGQEKFDEFLYKKFHTTSRKIKNEYITGGVSEDRCASLRYSAFYSSDDEMVVINNHYLYFFQRMGYIPRDAGKSFDCSRAQSNVERMICGNPELVKMDATVNRGFVYMQRVYSREISYQDPVRVDQVNWLRNERNKCINLDCLFDAYKSRIGYIKSKVSGSYPFYPAEEPDQPY